MIPRVFLGVVLGGLLLLGHPRLAAQEEVERHWEQVRAFVKRGAYRDCLQELEIILQQTPQDSWALAYRDLCTKRLRAETSFAQPSRTAFESLKGSLAREEVGRRAATAERRAIERKIQAEQAEWDAQMERLKRETIREQEAKARQAKADAVRQARARRQQRRQAQAEAVRQLRQRRAEARPQPPAPAEPPAPSREPALPARPSVELKPVIVPSAPTPAAPSPEPTAPGVAKAPPVSVPLGAVHIEADQLSVHPDRRLAIAQGYVRVVGQDAVLVADRATVFTDTQDAYAEGRVQMVQGSQTMRGEFAHYNFKTKKGRFLQGTLASPPWYEHGRRAEHLAEGVMRVTPGYLTSCELEPPHFRFWGRQATVFSADKLARAKNATFFVERLPLIYLPWLVVADRQSPFFIIPGKKKPWEQFALMGYRYEWPANHKGTLRLDWRRAFGWAIGMDHRFEDERLGRGLLKLYYNEESNRRRPREELPKGADVNRYRVLWRHNWQPLPDTTMVTDIQEFSDVDFRRELLFREEFVGEDAPESFISTVTNDPNYTLSFLVRKRMNRFQTVTQAFPDATIDIKPQRIGETQLFSETRTNFANLQTKTAHSEVDTDVVRLDWFHRLSYALNLFRPIMMTPKVGVRQTYYTKARQDRVDAERDVFSGQFSMGLDTSLKLFRIFPVVSDRLGLNLNWLRHVLTPTIAYSYIHEPTIPNDLLNFATASAPTNELSFGVENKLQTKRPGIDGKLRSIDLARWILSVPYTFQGSGNKDGGRLGDWAFDVELYPWPWMRLETDWSYPSRFVKGTRDSRVKAWNADLVMVGGRGKPEAQKAPDIQAPIPRAFEPGPRGPSWLLPYGQWYLGIGHRYSHNSRTEDVIQFDWRLTEKWQIGTFHRLTWKEVAGTSKRFNNVREVQYSLRRDLHDWIAELIWRVDREFGEEFFFTLTLKAYPELPIEIEESYHQPKIGSQSSPFSPLRGRSVQ